MDPMVNRMRPKPRRVGQVCAAVALLGLLVPSAGRAAPAKDSPVYGGTLTLANQVDADSLDPAGNPVNEVIWLDQNYYEKLVQASPDGTSIQPQLATSWDIAKNGLTYTFHLRTAKFHNGAPVTAADVKYSLDRAIAYKGGWGFLVNAIKTITATDTKTVTISLSHPWAPLLADLAIYAMSIMPADLLKKQGAKFFDHPIGSGPYEFVSWAKGSTITLQRNPLWWGPKPYLDTVKIVNVPNDTTRTLQLQGKQADVIENPPANQLAQISANSDLAVGLFPSTRVDFIQLDEHFAPFKDRLVRQAINYGIDRSAIIKIVFAGHATAATSFMPPMLDWNPSQKGYSYDLAKAKALLAKSGYPHGFTCNLIEVSNDVAGNGAAVIMKSELAQIGVTVNIVDYELITAYAKMDEKNGNPPSQMGARYWTNDIIDPDEVVSFAVDPQAGAHAFSTWYNDPVVTKLVHQAQVELDAARRRALYYQIQQISTDDAHLINLYYSPYRYAQGNWVHGFHVSPIGVYQLDKIWMSAH